MMSRTVPHGNAFSSWASSERVSVTACAEAARSSPRKLQLRIQMALPDPKKGRVCRAARTRARTVSSLGIYYFVVHAAQFSAPAIIDLASTVFDGELIIAMNEDKRGGGTRR